MQRIAQILFFVLVVKPFLVLFLGLRVRGRQYLLNKDPFILVANHASHLDTVALLGSFPLSRLAKIRPVAAADYFERNPIVSRFTRTFFNILPIARARFGPETNPLNAMGAALKAGESLVFFPEGTRDTKGKPFHFQPGIAHLLEKWPDVPVVPSYLQNTGRSLPKGSFLPVPLFCEVRLGPAQHPTGSRSEVVASLEAAVLALKEQE